MGAPSVFLALFALVAEPTAALATTGPAAARARRIDLELQNADIHDVLRLFSDIGHVNIVARAGVSGRVTARLHSVPWDDALRAILRAMHLGMLWQGNVIYVAPLEESD